MKKERKFGLKEFPRLLFFENGGINKERVICEYFVNP